MKTGKITAKLRDAVPVCLMVNGRKSNGIRTLSYRICLKRWK